jgi:hypothetical protein
MITIDRLESQIEKLCEKIRALNFAFQDNDLAKEGEDALSEATAALENFLELASDDWENRPQTDESEESDET